MYDEGDEKVFVINVVEREHRTAVEQKFGGKGLEAEVLQGDAQRRLRTFCDGGDRGDDEEKRKDGAKEAVRRRIGSVGNRHGTERVSLHYRYRVGVMFHRRRSYGNVCRLGGTR